MPRKSCLMIACLLTGVSTAMPARAAADPASVAEAALREAPVWDGHNDVPEQLRDRRRNMLGGFDFIDTSTTGNAAEKVAPMQTDLARLRKGHVGAQFWSVYVSARLDEQHAVQATLEQIDVTKRLIAANPDALQLATSSTDVERAMKAGKIASLLGMEGGHSIGSSLAVLRQMYDLGARYLTLTHFRNTPWADSATDKPEHDGLTDFGRDVVSEMQRIGMLVDLSHVSEATMLDTLEVAKAPVIFSHSNARGVNGHPRNVSDRVLQQLAANGGLVMVNFYPDYVVEATRLWLAERDATKARIALLNLGAPEQADARLAEWIAQNPKPRGTIADVADNIDHIVKTAGIDNVGLGGDFDGVDVTVEGMEDVSTYPALFTELARRGYGKEDLAKISNRNIMRVLKSAERYAAASRSKTAAENPTSF